MICTAGWDFEYKSICSLIQYVLLKEIVKMGPLLTV